MITPLYYFKWLFQTYAYIMAGFSVTCLYEGFIIATIMFMLLVMLFGFIADDVIGYDIWKIESESLK